MNTIDFDHQLYKAFDALNPDAVIWGGNHYCFRLQIDKDEINFSTPIPTQSYKLSILIFCNLSLMAVMKINRVNQAIIIKDDQLKFF